MAKANCGGLLIDGVTIVKDATTKQLKVADGVVVLTPATYQADSVATDVAGIVADFNALLLKLQTAGLMATE